MGPDALAKELGLDTKGYHALCTYALKMASQLGQKLEMQPREVKPEKPASVPKRRKRVAGRKKKEEKKTPGKRRKTKPEGRQVIDGDTVLQTTGEGVPSKIEAYCKKKGVPLTLNAVEALINKLGGTRSFADKLGLDAKGHNSLVVWRSTHREKIKGGRPEKSKKPARKTGSRGGKRGAGAGPKESGAQGRQGEEGSTGHAPTGAAPLTLESLSTETVEKVRQRIEAMPAGSFREKLNATKRGASYAAKFRDGSDTIYVRFKAHWGDPKALVRGLRPRGVLSEDAAKIALLTELLAPEEVGLKKGTSPDDLDVLFSAGK